MLIFLFFFCFFVVWYYLSSNLLKHTSSKIVQIGFGFILSLVSVSLLGAGLNQLFGNNKVKTKAQTAIVTPHEIKLSNNLKIFDSEDVSFKVGGFSPFKHYIGPMNGAFFLDGLKLTEFINREYGSNTARANDNASFGRLNTLAYVMTIGTLQWNKGTGQIPKKCFDDNGFGTIMTSDYKSLKSTYIDCGRDSFYLFPDGRITKRNEANGYRDKTIGNWYKHIYLVENSKMIKDIVEGAQGKQVVAQKEAKRDAGLLSDVGANCWTMAQSAFKYDYDRSWSDYQGNGKLKGGGFWYENDFKLQNAFGAYEKTRLECRAHKNGSIYSVKVGGRELM